MRDLHKGLDGRTYAWGTYGKERIEPRMPLCHVLKCDYQAYHDVAVKLKKCEVRQNDRDYRVNDMLHMKQTHGDEVNTLGRETYTGRELFARITHIQCGYGLPHGVVVLSIEVQ